MNRELRTECPLCASALYSGDTCPQHCSVLDVAEVFEQRLAHLQKALNERELELLRVKGERDKFAATLTKISAIRDSIVGLQGFNFSEHAYPLVAALDEAGFAGAGYEIASANLGTLIEQRDRAIAARDAARARLAVLESEVKRIRHVLRNLRVDCHRTFDGGYHDARDREIFHHGMNTVCNAIEGTLIAEHIDTALAATKEEP